MMRFQCTQCGECCSHIRGLIPQEDKQFLKEFAYGKLPLVSLFPIEKMSFPLFDFEAKRFKKWAMEVNVNPKIKPSRVIFDLKSNKSIIFTYYMDYDACPFLKNKKCLIYNKKRAFICRLFPFNRGPFLDTGEKLSKNSMFGSCPSVLPLLSKLDDTDKAVFVRQLYDIFSSDFLDIIEYDYLTTWVNKLIIDLFRRQLIKPAINYPYNFLLKRINNSEKIDLSDFLVINKIKTHKEIESLIKDFDTNSHAHKLLGDLINDFS
jgi:Fe-S-cluster containining protein